MEVEPPQTKSFSQRIWFVLKKAMMILNLIYSSFAPTTISSEVKPPPENKEKMNHQPPPQPPSPSFSLLPDDIFINILSRISKSYYPELSLMSKTVHSLILSKELYHDRLFLRIDEEVLHVCLQLPTSHSPSWFALWIKPNQTLTNDLEDKKKTKGKALLVSVPSPCSPFVPQLMFTLGSEIYAIRRYSASPSSYMCVRSNDIDSSIYAWHKAPRMKEARESAVTGVLDGKIYVMGGCRSHKSNNWAEVFDPKTQTWEPLPDPGAELCASSIKRMDMYVGKICVKSSLDVDYVYYLEESRWEVERKALDIEDNCVVENVVYYCGNEGVLWFDEESEERRKVKGLGVLDWNCPFGMIGIANYGGKLLVFWDKFVSPHHCEKKEIWCAMIALERRNNGDEVWGDVEWASPVFTVPSSYDFLRCVVSLV